MASLARLFQAVRRLRPSQVGHRVVRQLETLVRRDRSAPPWAVWSPLPAMPPEARRPTGFPFDGPEGDGWRFAGRRATLAAPGLAWDGEASLLQRYHAAYAESVRTLAEGGDLARAKAVRTVVATGAPDHPYVRSRRVLSLVEARIAGLADADAAIVLDAEEIARRPEWDVRGNHLLANGAALLRAGCAFRGAAARRWKARGRAILATCAGDQVLADGVHYERSPVYAALVLEHLLVALESCAARGEAPPAGVEDAVARLAVALDETTLPDGAPARWRDGAPGVALATDALVAWARRRVGPLRDRRRGSRAFEAAGLAIVESADGTSAVTLAAAPACPPDLPAHGHADALAFEAVMDGVRVVASAGTADYAAGAARDADRRPGAFAGLLVDGEPWADPFDAFRVGARGWARRLETGVTSGWRWASATAGGFLGAPGVTMHRTVAIAPGGEVVVLDEGTGRGTHRVEQFLPLAPGFSAAVEPDGASAAVAREGLALRVTTPGARLSVEEGSYAAGLGVRVPRVVLRASAERALPGRTAIVIAKGAEPLSVRLETIDGYEVRVVLRRPSGETTGYLPIGQPA